jgi:hypothetical protein
VPPLRRRRDFDIEPSSPSNISKTTQLKRRQLALLLFHNIACVLIAVDRNVPDRGVFPH